MSLFSSCSGTNFFSLMKQSLNPGIHSTSPFPSLIFIHQHYHRISQRAPQTPHVCIFWIPGPTISLSYGEKKIYPFLSSLSCGDPKAGSLSPDSTLSKLLCFPAPPKLSKPGMSFKLREPHKVSPRGHQESSKLFSVSQHTLTSLSLLARARAHTLSLFSLSLLPRRCQ